LLQLYKVTCTCRRNDNFRVFGCATYVSTAGGYASVTKGLNDYYDRLIAAVQHAAECTIPSTFSRSSNRYNVPGWNTFLHDKHAIARQAYKDWV